ncbi:MAG: hypothetical protein H7329_12510 [Opitutaceae bacterium]|nr:hypothetical protein [Cytophagales bacterium]
MTSVDILRNTLIDKILTITDKDYLTALHKLIQASFIDKGIVTLTEEQLEMLKMSDNDIAANKLVSQSDMDKMDLEWLKSL